MDNSPAVALSAFTLAYAMLTKLIAKGVFSAEETKTLFDDALSALEKLDSTAEIVNGARKLLEDISGPLPSQK
jgi:hypothetical protein